MRVIYLKGWIRPDSMDVPGWFDEWQKEAWFQEATGFQLVVFAVPASDANNAIEMLEGYLQEKYGKGGGK